MAVLSGIGVTLIYFYLFNAVVKFSRRLGPELAGAVALASYVVRLGTVAALLLVGIGVGGLDPLVTGVTFMVSFSVMFIYTQGRVVRSPVTGWLLERKE